MYVRESVRVRERGRESKRERVSVREGEKERECAKNPSKMQKRGAASRIK